MLDQVVLPLAASMGPLFFRAENLLPPRHPLRGPLLQWGRSFSERRTGMSVWTSHRPTRLQWGRSFSERRTFWETRLVP